MKPRRIQPNIQNLYPKTEDFKRIMEAMNNKSQKTKLMHKLTDLIK